MRRPERKFKERVNEIRAAALDKYVRVTGDDSGRLEIGKLPTDELVRLVDDKVEELRDKTKRCSTCRFLYANEFAVRNRLEDSIFYQRCDRFYNPLWKDPSLHRHKEHARRPSNKACPNYEEGDNAFQRRRRERFSNKNNHL